MKRYESDRVHALSVTMNGLILLINVYFPVTCHEKYYEYICLGTLSSLLESHEEDHVCILGDFNAYQVHRVFMVSVM